MTFISFVCLQRLVFASNRNFCSILLVRSRLTLHSFTLSLCFCFCFCSELCFHSSADQLKVGCWTLKSQERERASDELVKHRALVYSLSLFFSFFLSFSLSLCVSHLARKVAVEQQQQQQHKSRCLCLSSRATLR